MDKSKNPKKEKVKPGTQPKRGPKGSQSADMDWLSDRMEKKKQIGDNTQMNYSNAYVKRLMEMDGPTDKDLDDIKKEKPAKIPKKKYFGGKTDPKKVDTKAAIASHKKGIRAAGEKSKLSEVTSIPRDISSGDRYPSHVTPSRVLRKRFADRLKKTPDQAEKRKQRKDMAKRTGQEKETSSDRDEASRSTPKDTNESRSSLELRRNATQQQAMERRKNSSTPSKGSQSKPSKGDGMKSTSLTRKIKSGEYNRAGKGGGPRISRVGVGQDETKDKREHGSIRDHAVYHRIGTLMAEALGLVESEFPKGPTAKRYDSLGKAKDTNGGTAAIKDPLVKKETEKTKANIDKKTQSSTNPNVSDLVQGSMNRRRGESRRRGTGGLPQETRKEAKADADHSRKKVQDAGDR